MGYDVENKYELKDMEGGQLNLTLWKSKSDRPHLLEVEIVDKDGSATEVNFAVRHTPREDKGDEATQVFAAMALLASGAEDLKPPSGPVPTKPGWYVRIHTSGNRICSQVVRNGQGGLRVAGAFRKDLSCFNWAYDPTTGGAKKLDLG